MSKIMLSVSFVLAGLMPVLSYAAPTAPQPVYMTSQIQRLLNEKQEKISKLEECDGKRKGFMIAGISTLGLTAVGVGVNIAQASKSNKLSNQIADQNLELEKQQNNLANINSQISEKQSDKARRECEENSAMQWVDGRCVPKTEQPVATNTPEPAKEYDGKIGDSCGEGKVWFVTFNNPTKKCLGMSGIVSCDCIPGERYDGTIGQPCTGDVEGSVWTKDGDKKCLVAEGSKESVACSCKKSSDAVAANPIPTPVVARDPNPAVVANPNPTPTETQPQAPSTPQTRDAKITGYCLNKEGDTGSLDESQKTFCWCDIYMVDYCAKSKLFDGQSGVCDLSTNAGAACQRFCESKKADFISFCDSLQ